MSFVEYNPHAHKCKRKISEEQWERYQPRIEQLQKSKNIEEIIQIMGQDGFMARYGCIHYFPVGFLLK
jgi:hypothetical protein